MLTLPGCLQTWRCDLKNESDRKSSLPQVSHTGLRPTPCRARIWKLISRLDLNVLSHDEHGNIDCQYKKLYAKSMVINQNGWILKPFVIGLCAVNINKTYVSKDQHGYVFGKEWKMPLLLYTNNIYI